MNPLNILTGWKSKPFHKTNYENIHAYYADQKYIRMKPKSQIGLSPGFLKIVLKHPMEYVLEGYHFNEDITLFNETHTIVYFTLKNCLLSHEENQLKLHIKNGVDTKESWDNLN